MRSFIAFLSAAFIALPAISLGQERPASRDNKSANKESVWEVVMSVPDQASPFCKTGMAHGTVIGIEKDLARFTLRLADDNSLIIQMEMRTSLRMSGNEIEIWDLRLGDRVTVAYRVEEGRNVARSVTVER